MKTLYERGRLMREEFYTPSLILHAVRARPLGNFHSDGISVMPNAFVRLSFSDRSGAPQQSLPCRRITTAWALSFQRRIFQQHGRKLEISAFAGVIISWLGFSTRTDLCFALHTETSLALVIASQPSHINSEMLAYKYTMSIRLNTTFEQIHLTSNVPRQKLRFAVIFDLVPLTVLKDLHDFQRCRLKPFRHFKSYSSSLYLLL